MEKVARGWMTFQGMVRFRGRNQWVIYNPFMHCVFGVKTITDFLHLSLQGEP
jgi:hypothetical protein